MSAKLPADKTRLPPRHGWSLRHYMTLFMVVLLAVACAAAITVRVMAQQDARLSAEADASFAAQRAANQIKSGFDQIQAVSSSLANDPSIGQLFADPTKCNIGYAPVGAFTTGHIDIVRLDGSVVCSSSKAIAGNKLPMYAGQAWLEATTPVVVSPTVDPTSGNQVAVATYPIQGKGAFVWFLDLAPLGPHLEAQFGSGVHQLEFLITSNDGTDVAARSIKPEIWVGKNLGPENAVKRSDPTTRPDLSGTQRIYGRSDVGWAGWVLYVGADEAGALSTANQASNRALAIILAGVACMLVVTFVVYRRVAEPVRRLSKVMQGSTSGSALVAVGPGATEVTDLAQDFDQLMETVKRELAERLDSEQAAVVSERNYRMLFDAHPQPMWLYDTDTLAFLDVNDAAVKRYGYSHAEFLTMTIKDIRPPQDIPKFLELVSVPMPAFDKSGPWRHLLKDGSTVQVLVTSHAITFANHNARFVLAEDLTESQRLELELHQSQARIEAAAELSRAKDEMVSMVSHEMRTPLASIVGFTELLATREVTSEQHKEYLSVMLQEGHRLSALINDFLDLRRIEGGHTTMRFAPASISALINRAVELFNDPSQSRIETRFANELPLVRVDGDAVFRVLANLLSNARKYSPNGGAIVVGAEVINGTVEISVKDEGLGIPGDALTHLFQKFYRVDTADRRAIKGTGLGLAISKKIVEAHGGSIGARSDGAGKGATFYFTVPAVREQAQIGDVLVVEDDSGFAHLLEAELSQRGISSVWAPDAETAEHLMKSNGARAVVLDLLLPGLSGEAFLSQLRDRYGAAIPVVVVTLKDLDQLETVALQKVGVTAVLRKGPGMAEAAANLVAKSLAAELVAR